jgi:hypothetical protein
MRRSPKAFSTMQEMWWAWNQAPTVPLRKQILFCGEIHVRSRGHLEHMKLGRALEEETCCKSSLCLRKWGTAKSSDSSDIPISSCVLHCRPPELWMETMLETHMRASARTGARGESSLKNRGVWKYGKNQAVLPKMAQYGTKHMKKCNPWGLLPYSELMRCEIAKLISTPRCSALLRKTSGGPARLDAQLASHRCLGHPQGRCNWVWLPAEPAEPWTAAAFALRSQGTKHVENLKKEIMNLAVQNRQDVIIPECRFALMDEIATVHIVPKIPKDLLDS